MSTHTSRRPRAASRRPSRARPASGRRPKASPAAAAAPRRDDGRQRLQKVLAAAGVAARRECEQLILDGRVEVDRQVVTELGTRVDPSEHEIRVDGEVLVQPKLVYYAIHKPKGVVSTSRDQAGRLRVIDLLPPGGPRVYCVGRLDMSSEGLILVTNDGGLANGLTHPRHGVEKTYHAQVSGRLEPPELQSLRRGVRLAEGWARVKFVRIKSYRKQSTILEMILDEGRNREVRRLMARVGHKVQRLVRVAVGPVRLGDMPPGAVRPLMRTEITALRRAVEAKPQTKERPRRAAR